MVASSSIHALQQRGFRVHLAVLGNSGLTWNSDQFGAPPDRIIRLTAPHLLRRTIQAFDHSLPTLRRAKLYLSLPATLYALLTPFYHRGYELVLNTNYLVGGADFGYIHYPDAKPPLMHQLTPIWRSSLFLAKKIVCNSSWTSQAVERRLGLRAEVLYPPVHMVSPPPRSKEDLVVGVGRISPDKNWERFVRIAAGVKKRRSVKFVIVGHGYDARPGSYCSKLVVLADGKVHLALDVTEEAKWRILSEAKVLLHTKSAEHFGIGVVEAMSAGAVPVVNRDGGAWTDILEKGRYGYGYSDDSSAVEAVLNALDDEALAKQVRVKAAQFSEERFRDRLLSLLKL
jgi:glycosyltransferase involved in cell wall biosynthesis